jgi:hypothetical protein
MTMAKKISIFFPYRNISILFDQKDDDRDARARRDILSWYIESVNKAQPIEEFRHRDLGNWLLDNHLPFRDEFAGSHTKRSYRLHSKRTYIQSRINELVDLRIIEKKGTAKAEKNKEVDIPIYSFTQFGRIFAWLLEARYTNENKNIRSKAIEMFFRELSSYINTGCGASSTVDLFANFFKQCIEEGVHNRIRDDYLEMFINLLPTDASFLPQHFLHFLRQFLLSGLYMDEECARIFLELIEESDEQTKELILLQLKLDIESYYCDGMGATLEWEIERRKYIHDPMTVVVQVYCLECKLKNVTMIRLLDFLKMGGHGHAPAYSLNGNPAAGDSLPDLDADRRLGVIFRIITLPYCNIKYKENVSTLIPILYVPPRHLNPHVLTTEYIEHIFEEFFPQAKGTTLTDIIIKNDEKE